jgi:hypothetical protein
VLALERSYFFSESEAALTSKHVSGYGVDESYIGLDVIDAMGDEVGIDLIKSSKGGKVKEIQAQADERRNNRSKDTQARIDRCRSSVSEEMLIFFKTSFETYDDNGDGVLDRAELRHILADLDYRVTNDELDTMLQVFDADGSDGIDKDEFITMMAAAVHPPHSQEELYEVITRHQFLFALLLSSVTPHPHCSIFRCWMWQAHGQNKKMARSFHESITNNVSKTYSKTNLTWKTSITGVLPLLCRDCPRYFLERRMAWTKGLRRRRKSKHIEKRTFGSSLIQSTNWEWTLASLESQEQKMKNR